MDGMDALGLALLLIVVVVVVAGLLFIAIRHGQGVAPSVTPPAGQGPGYRHDAEVVRYHQQPGQPMQARPEEPKKKPAKVDPRSVPLPRCTKCGAAIAFRDERCPKCGHSLRQEPEQSLSHKPSP